MKKAIVIYSLRSGGAERVATILANAWRREGDSVRVFCLVPPEAPFFELDETIDLIHLDMAGDSSGALSATIGNAQRVLRLRRAIKDYEPDLVVSFMTTANVLTILACLGLGARVVVTEHTHPPVAKLGRIWNRGRSLTYRFSDLVTAPTELTCEWLRTHTGARNVQAIPNPLTVPLPHASPQISVAEHIAAGTHLILAAGRLSREKGFDLLIEAASAVLSTKKDWKLAILGEGPLRSELQTQIERYNLEASVSLIGRVGNISDWYERAEVYVMSSRYEGFGNTLAEAMAHGCACISFDCDAGPRAIIQSDQEGILIPQLDIGALRETLIRLIEDTDLRTRLQSNAALARERFSEATVSSHWRVLIDSL